MPWWGSVALDVSLRCGTGNLLQTASNPAAHAMHLLCLVAMKLLRIEDIREVTVAPDGWELASENGWGYLALVSLQETGHLAQIIRVPRDTERLEFRNEIDESIASFVEDTSTVEYAENFLEWHWYVQTPLGAQSFWSDFNAQVNKRLVSSAPLPEETYQAMLQALTVL